MKLPVNYVVYMYNYITQGGHGMKCQLLDCAHVIVAMDSNMNV